MDDPLVQKDCLVPPPETTTTTTVVPDMPQEDRVTPRANKRVTAMVKNCLSPPLQITSS